MNYPFLLKFSSITNLSDARYAAGMWADFIGFCFDPASSDYIEPNKAKEIAGWINGPLIVGEFSTQPVEWIRDFVIAIPLHALQVPADYADLSIVDLGLPLILSTATGNETPLMQFAKCLITDNENVLQMLKEKTDLPILYQAKNGVSIKNIEQYSGIAFKGENETSPGVRNHEAWTALLEPFMD